MDYDYDAFEINALMAEIAEAEMEKRYVLKKLGGSSDEGHTGYYHRFLEAERKIPLLEYELMRMGLIL